MIHPRQFAGAFLIGAAFTFAVWALAASLHAQGAGASAPGHEYPEITYFGLRVKIDARTGCHYLHAGDALTPRLDMTGKQICTGTK